MSAKGFSFTSQQLNDIVQHALSHARAHGASSCQAEISEGFGQTASVRIGDVDTIEYNRDKGFGVTVYIGQQRGHASSSDFSMEAIQSCVDAALSIARFTAADECAGLPDAALQAKSAPDLDLHHPWRPSVEEMIETARQCEDAAYATDKNIKNSEGASVSSQESQFFYGDSAGFGEGFASSQHSISCSVIAGEGDSMQREYWYDARRDAATLQAASAIGEKAARRALARVGARKIPTCETPVLFEAPLSVSLIGNLVYAASGGALYRKSSFLLDSLGKQIMPSGIHIRENPHLSKTFGVTWFDDEGVATQPRDIVRDGVLQGYFLSSYSARKLGMQTTANAGGSHKLIVEGGEHDFGALVKKMHRGLIVTELLGQGVNYVNGDYSRGAAGYWVENGEITHPVEEITIAGNLLTMFRSIAAIGNDALDRGAKHCGSILLESMKIAGN